MRVANRKLSLWGQASCIQQVDAQQGDCQGLDQDDAEDDGYGYQRHLGGMVVRFWVRYGGAAMGDAILVGDDEMVTGVGDPRTVPWTSTA